MEAHGHGGERPPLIATAHPSARPTCLSVLAVVPPCDSGPSAAQLIELAARIGASGHRLRVVGAPGPPVHNSPARWIPCWPVRHASARLRLAGELVAYSKVIYQALSAEATDVVHCASLRMTRAASLATFSYTLRHPCTPEPAIVTTISGADGCDLVALQGSSRLRLPGDCAIVSTGHARDTILGGTHDQRLRERVFVVAATDDLVAAMVAVYHAAWERRQRENERALLPIEM